jgi:hypothetical protein
MLVARDPELAESYGTTAAGLRARAGPPRGRVLSSRVLRLGRRSCVTIKKPTTAPARPRTIVAMNPLLSRPGKCSPGATGHGEARPSLGIA